MKMRPVICNKCATEFKIKKINKRYINDAVEGRITISYFSCPKCKENYTSFVENEKLKNLIQEKKKVYAGIRKLKDPAEIEAVFQKFSELEKKTERLHNHLKFVFKER